LASRIAAFVKTFPPLPSTTSLIMVCGFLAFSSWAQTPVVVYDSFGPGDTYRSSTVFPVQGSDTSPGYRGHAEWFVPAISGNFYSALLANVRIAGTGRSNFFLAEDSGFNTPGTILESFLGRGASAAQALNSTVRPPLVAGVKYWLCAEPSDTLSFSGWFENNQGVTPGYATEAAPWSWSTLTAYAPPSGVFRVSVIPVPEPTSVALISLGLLVMARRFATTGE
jgi:hypothetical protein